MPYNKPFAEKIVTENICDYGCGQPASYKFRNEKYCCSSHFNSCPGKRKQFSERTDHKERNQKSLETRKRLGITKSSQIKAAKTRRENGHYERLAERMRQHWKENPWDNNPYCPVTMYKETKVYYQGSYELMFLENLENEHNLEWVKENVQRGPSIKYLDENKQERLYISDFQIDNTIYEIKSSYYWNRELERNQCKLNACLNQGFNVILVLDGEEIKYGSK